MKALTKLKISSMIVLLSMSGLVYGEVISNAQNGTEKCIDQNAESPSENVSKSAIGIIFDTFSDVNFCKDQFLVKNDYIGFCGCEEKNKLTETEKEQVELGVIERESLALALDENKSHNKESNLNKYLIEIMDLKLAIPSSCLQLIESQNETKEKCQSNKKRWSILKSISKTDHPLEQLDSIIDKYKARKTLQQILIDDTNRAGFSFLMGQSIMTQFSLIMPRMPFDNATDSLGLTISNGIGLNVRNSLTGNFYIESEEILSSFLTDEDNNNYSDMVISNENLGVDNITEQRQLTAELLPLFKNEKFKLAFAVSIDKYVTDKKLDPKNLSSNSFQRILIKTLEKVVADNQQKTSEAKVSCEKIKKSAEYACFETEFNDVEVSKELYQKHLAALFPSRIAGKVACTEVKESKIPWSNKSIATYLNVSDEIKPLIEIATTTSSSGTVSGIDSMVDSLEQQSSDSNISNKDNTNYIEMKDRASTNRTIVNSGSNAGRSYANALASGDKLKIKKASKKLEKDIVSSKEKARLDKLSREVKNDKNNNDGTTKIAKKDDLSEMRKVEQMIRDNEDLYGLDDKKSDDEFASQFNVEDPFKKKNKEEEYSSADYFSTSSIEPEPLAEEELSEEDKSKVDGAKGKLDGLINRYEDLLAKQEKKNNGITKAKKDPEVDARISQLQKSIEDLKSQKNDLLKTIDNKEETTPVISKVRPTAVKRRISGSSKKRQKKKKYNRKAASNTQSTYSTGNSGNAKILSTEISNSSGNGSYKSKERESSIPSTYSGVRRNTAPKLTLRSPDMVISSNDFTEYSSSDFKAYFDRFGSEPLVVKRQIEIKTDGIKTYQDVLDYYFPEVESGNIKYVKRNPEEVRQAISNVMSKNRFDTQIDLTLRTVAKHSELIQLLEN